MLDPKDRERGAELGMRIGDALAMPGHWYYNIPALKRDYGDIRDFIAPKNPHPGSFLGRARYSPLNEKGEILHEQAEYWGKEGIHYHQFLKPGENTVNTRLALNALACRRELGRWDRDEQLGRFIDFHLTPGTHNDTYLEEYIRTFFTNYAQGKAPEDCAANREDHMGGLLAALAVMIPDAATNPEIAKHNAFAQMHLTHQGPDMDRAAPAFVDLVLAVFAGTPLPEAVQEILKTHRAAFLHHDFDRLTTMKDEYVAQSVFATACELEYSTPLTFHLLRKYANLPETCLVASTNLGGDNVHKGAILGLVLGAAHGPNAFPERWVKGLVPPFA